MQQRGQLLRRHVGREEARRRGNGETLEGRCEGAGLVLIGEALDRILGRGRGLLGLGERGLGDTADRRLLRDVRLRLLHQQPLVGDDWGDDFPMDGALARTRLHRHHDEQVQPFAPASDRLDLYASGHYRRERGEHEHRSHVDRGLRGLGFRYDERPQPVR